MKLYVLSNLWRLSMVQVFAEHNVTLAPYMHGYDMVQIDGGERPASSKADSSRLSIAK